MNLITDTDALRQFCAPLHDEDYITVDTEFMREKTYWPQLCLVQVGGRDGAAAIDPLAEGIDLAPLYALFDDPGVVKVFHAARQDLEIFLHLTDRLPAPLFDTQVAAMVCGFGESVGYEQLVSKLAKAQLDKGSRFTDWSIRPLSERQINYALADVTHLRVAYEKLLARLERENRTAWIEEEMTVLAEPTTYRPDPEEVYKRIKGRRGNGRFLAVLRELAAWREREAQRRDLPRNRVLRDETLVEIAHHTPKNADSLSRTRGLGAKAAKGPMGAAILKAVDKAQGLPKSEWPEPPARPDLPRGIGPIADLIKVLLKKVAEDTHVAGRLIANSADVDLIAGLGEDADVAALKGWRREIFGGDALRLRAGELALSVDGTRLIVTEAEGRRAAE
ncbi:MAG: ribonuclease D [Magnetovibrio sp.]|nr:ribonuclease D [Magnetovibrio sp.]